MAQLNSTNVIGNLSITGQLAAAGNSVFNGPVTILSTADAALGTANSGALKIGNVNGEHLSLDSNEIMAKTTDGKTKATLHLNNDGGIVKIGPDGLTTTGSVSAGNVVLHKTTISAGNTSTTCTLTLPTSTGTLALTSQIPTSLKNPTSLTIQGNGTSLGSYDGSQAKTINITYSNVGAAASSHSHNYAGSSSAGGSATTANALTIFNAKDYETNATRREGLLKYIQMSSGATTYDITPSDDWWSIIRTQHAGYDVGYWQEMAYAFHSDDIKFRRNKNGTKTAWKTIAFTDSNITGAAAKVSNSLTVKGNGTQSFVYDGSEAKTLNIKAGTSVTVTSDTSGNITIASTDTKVTQEVQTASSYTNWRPLVIGSSNSSTEGFTPSNTTDKTFVFNTLSVQPSTGTIRAKVFKIDNDVKFVYNSDDKCLDVIFG